MSDFKWIATAAGALFLGFAVANQVGSTAAIVRTADRLYKWLTAPPDQPARPALIVTANRGDQLTVVATLAPRGFAPLLAGSQREVLSQIRAHPGALRLAVVDATLPDYPFISRALNGILPADSIIVLKGAGRSQDIGPLLLDRLGVFDNMYPRSTHGSARKPPAPPSYIRVETATSAHPDLPGSIRESEHTGLPGSWTAIRTGLGEGSTSSRWVVSLDRISGELAPRLGSQLTRANPIRHGEG